MSKSFALLPASRRAVLALAAVPMAAVGLYAGSSEAARPHEVMVKITHVKAMDAIDNFSKGDFFARVLIGDAITTTPVAKQQAEIRPDWVVTEKVAPGKHKLRLQIFDKDLTADDLIDVNPLKGNRILEATIDTRSCRVSGYGKSYRCGSKVTVIGNEKKAAAVTFIVDVKR